MNIKKNRFIILFITGIALAVFIAAFRIGEFGTQFLWNISDQGAWLFPLITVAALLDSVNPCAFSILLLTIAFLVSIGRLRRSILSIGGAYIAGLFAVYFLIGIGLLQALHIFNTPHFMGKVGSVLLLLLGGVNIMNVLLPRIPIRIQLPASAHAAMSRYIEKASLPTAFALGALVGLCEFPCTGGPYLTAVGLLHDKTTVLSGFAYLAYYNILFISPLALILLLASDRAVLDKVDHWEKQNVRSMRLWTGIAMVALGILILFL